MKYIILLTIIFFTWGCHIFSKTETLMGKYFLSDGTVIEVIFVGYGSTSPNVIWVTKLKDDRRIAIGEIEGPDFRKKVNVFQTDNKHIKVRLTDTMLFKGQYNDYQINLDTIIDRNHGSPF